MSTAAATVTTGQPTAGTHPAVEALIDAYDGNTYRLLCDLADHLGATIAYVDRPTIEAHLERSLSDPQWHATNEEFAAMDLDEDVGDHGNFRTEWIEDLLAKAGVPGYGYTADGQPNLGGGAE